MFDGGALGFGFWVLGFVVFVLDVGLWWWFRWVLYWGCVVGWLLGVCRFLLGVWD